MNQEERDILEKVAEDSRRAAKDSRELREWLFESKIADHAPRATQLDRMMEIGRLKKAAIKALGWLVACVSALGTTVLTIHQVLLKFTGK